jgi:hypothetical protein
MIHPIVITGLALLVLAIAFALAYEALRAIGTLLAGLVSWVASRIRRPRRASITTWWYPCPPGEMQTTSIDRRPNNLKN